MAIIQAKAIITAEDQTGAVFDKIAKKFDSLGKSTKAAENVARLTNSLKDAEAQLKAIDKFQAKRTLFADAQNRFRDAQTSVEKAARAMAAAEKPTRAMEQAYKRARVAVSGASRAFEEQKAAVLGAKRVLESSGVPLSRLASEQEKLRTHVERTTRALRQQNRIVEASPVSNVARRGQIPSATGSTLQAIGETGAMYAAGRFAKHAVAQGSDFQHERARMEAAGMSPGEIASAEEEAAALSRKYLPVGRTQIMHLLRNTRSTVGSYHEAAEIADPLLAMRVVAMGAHPERSDELDADFDKLVKGMEIKGVTQNMPKFRHYIDTMSKAVNTFGDTIRPTDFYEAFKYGRASTNALGDDFMLSTAPTLIQELGGSSTGKALSSFHTQFVGGKMSNRAVEQLQKYRMLDPSKVIKTKTGNVKGVLPGGVVGQEFLKPGQEDPYAWVNQVLLPHLAAQGVTDPAEIQEVISGMASQTTTAQMMGIFATQQARIQKDRGLQAGAKGTAAAADFMRNDPKIGAKSILEQSNNILSAATAPAMEKAAPVMHAFAGSLAEIAEVAASHPAMSTIASGGILSSIVAGGAKGASWLLPALFGTMPEGGVAGALGSTLGAAAKWGLRGSGWTTAAMLAYEAYQNRDAIGADLVGRGEHATSGDPWRAAYDRDHPTDTLERLRRERDERDASRPAASNQQQLTGTVTGDATLTVKIDAPELIRTYTAATKAIRLMGSLIGQNGPGSEGISSPDAAAPGLSGRANGPGY